MLFSMEKREYESIIIDWVEEVLNNKVITSVLVVGFRIVKVEEVLNNKVITSAALPAEWASGMDLGEQSNIVDIVLNCNEK